jgi:predicted Kef-type K+ transport protein
LSQANKLSRTYAALLDALNRHRGKGQQKVTVEHVHVIVQDLAMVLALVLLPPVIRAIADQVSVAGRFGVSVADLRKISQTFALDTTMMVISRPDYAASRIFPSLELMPNPGLALLS